MLQLFTQSSGYLVPDNDKPANLISNDYFPFINLGILDNNEGYFSNSIKTYYKPSITKEVRVKTNSSRNILETLTFSQSIYKYAFSSAVYFIGKGIIMDYDGKILLLITVKRDVFKTFAEKRRELSEDYKTFSHDNFVMFVASELAFKVEHSVFYRRLQKIYLNFCFEKGMEVRFLPSSTIEKNTFANSLNLRFNSIDQLDYHLRNEVKNFLIIPESSASERSLHICIPPTDIVEPEETITTNNYDILREESYSGRGLSYEENHEDFPQGVALLTNSTTSNYVAPANINYLVSDFGNLTISGSGGSLQLHNGIVSTTNITTINTPEEDPEDPDIIII